MDNIAKEVLEVDEKEVEKVIETLGEHGKKIEEHDRAILAHEKKIASNCDKLDEHDKEITDLQMKDINFEGRFNSIDLQFVEVKNCLTRIENNNYQSTNLLVSTISSIAQANSKSSNEIAKVEAKGEAEITKIRLNNNAKFVLKTLAIISGVISILLTGYFSAKYGITIQGIK